MIENSEEGVYALMYHHAESSKGIGFIIIMFMISKEKQWFISLFKVYKYRWMSKIYIHQNF